MQPDKSIDRPWRCPECDARYRSVDGECAHECAADLIHDPSPARAPNYRLPELAHRPALTRWEAKQIAAMDADAKTGGQCPRCVGAGFPPTSREVTPEGAEVERACPDCDGSGIASTGNEASSCWVCQRCGVYKARPSRTELHCSFCASLAPDTTGGQCPRCVGAGFPSLAREVTPEGAEVERDCPDCDGSGIETNEKQP